MMGRHLIVLPVVTLLAIASARVLVIRNRRRIWCSGRATTRASV